VVALSENERPAGIALLKELREQGVNARMDYDSRKVQKQFRSADTAGARFCVILGEDEVAKGTVSLKDMKSGEQKELRRGELISKLVAD